MRRLGLAPAWCASALLHTAVLALLLAPLAMRPAGSVTPIEVEVELVEQAPHQAGAPAPTQAAAPAPPPAAPPAPAASTPDGDPATPPAPPAQPAKPAPEQRPESVRLGDADEDQEGLRVTGEHVLPPRGDRRNRPPSYPPEAARRHAEGTVSLLVHVTAAGQVAWVDVPGSSGDPDLDRAARIAVERWRFQPARNEAGPVPFDFPMTIRFRLGGDP